MNRNIYKVIANDNGYAVHNVSVDTLLVVIFNIPSSEFAMEIADALNTAYSDGLDDAVSALDNEEMAG